MVASWLVSMHSFVDVFRLSLLYTARLNKQIETRNWRRINHLKSFIGAIPVKCAKLNGKIISYPILFQSIYSFLIPIVGIVIFYLMEREMTI